MARPDSQQAMAELRQILLDAHGEVMDGTDDVLLGLQLTHSGRFCRPFRKDRMEPLFSTVTPYSTASLA